MTPTDDTLDTATQAQTNSPPEDDYEEFEVGEHQVPWFLWLFFIGILVWAAVSWIPFFKY